MSINLETALALLLLSLVVGGSSSIPSVAGQNAVSNITANDIIDLVDNNVTESNTENESPLTVGSGSSSIPSVAGQNAVSNITANDIIDLVDNNVTESNTENESPLPLGAIEGLSSIPFVNDADTSYVTAGDSILINEVELNPRGNDMAKEWIELYNPTAVDVNIGNFEIRPLFTSATIKLPSDAIIEAGETYVIELDRPMLSNTAESLVLANATGDIKDRTPSLVDKGDDERTWQRIPDGNNEWQFVENTRGNLNDPDNPTTTTTFDSVENIQGSLNNSDTLSRLLDNAYSESNVECVGSAGCVEGVVTRIVDGDTLYVRLNSTIYKVDLALIKAPSRTEEGFMESTAFTRDLCLGSNVLVDPDGMLPTSNSDVLAVVYCSSSNLNSELLDNGYAELETEQCATSEFANEPWVKDHGC
jgi:endonuclease YncB( thermonuclease family)